MVIFRSSLLSGIFEIGSVKLNQKALNHILYGIQGFTGDYGIVIQEVNYF